MQVWPATVLKFDSVCIRSPLTGYLAFRHGMQGASSYLGIDDTSLDTKQNWEIILHIQHRLSQISHKNV